MKKSRLNDLRVLLNGFFLLRDTHGWLARVPLALQLGRNVLGLVVRVARFTRRARPCPLFPATMRQTNEDGFGDRENSYAWSMAWFRGHLYVGTNRNFLLVEKAAMDFHTPGLNMYGTEMIGCDVGPPTPQDMNLQAEIWRYGPETETWERVFQSPEIPIPDHPGKHAALDIGFRDMVVFPEADGTEALYVAGVTAGDHNHGLPPPRILRSTDGVTFEPIPQQPGTFLGDLPDIGFRAMEVYKGRLYVTATPELIGKGSILESDMPAGGNDHFRSVSPEELEVFEMVVFNGCLYVGTGDEDRGYEVWKTDATGTPPYTFHPVVTNGAGRGGDVKCVVSMHVHRNVLYVGSCGWFPQLLPPCELIRIHPDDSWEVVVGNKRRTPDGVKAPISGLPDSFGNPFNVHVWRMQTHQGALYLGTCEDSQWVKVTPRTEKRIQDAYGSDLWRSEDGKEWAQVTRDGFGDRGNNGVRTLVSSSHGLFVGTANYVSGTEVWLVQPQEKPALNVETESSGEANRASHS